MVIGLGMIADRVKSRERLRGSDAASIAFRFGDSTFRAACNCCCTSAMPLVHGGGNLTQSPTCAEDVLIHPLLLRLICTSRDAAAAAAAAASCKYKRSCSRGVLIEWLW